MQNSILVGILSTLLAKKKVTAIELATKYEISVRTVMRDIDVINESGVPIVAYRGRNGGYGIIENYKLTSSFLTKEEYERIFSALETMPADKVTSSIRDKLTGLNTSSNTRLTQSDKVIIDTGFSSAFKNKFNVLQQAITDRIETHVSYIDKFGDASERTIQPLSFVYKDNTWYVYSFCLTRNDFRFFKINRISGISLTENHFEPRHFLLNESVLDKFLKESEHVDVTLSFDNDALVDIQEWLGEQSVIKKGAGYVAYARLPYDDFLLNKLIAFGTKVKVVKPARLCTDLVKYVYSLLNHYQRN